MTDISNFVQPLVDYSTQLIKSSARLAHVEDGAATLVPTGWTISRYIASPTGKALTAANAALTDMYVVSGNAVKMDRSVIALQAADLTNVTLVRLTGEALLAATNETFGHLMLEFVAAIQITAPRDSITLLQNLAYSIKITSTSPYSVFLYVAVLCALGQSILDYVPATSEEAITILNQYINLFDTTISPVSDIGWHDTGAALTALRANVLKYLQQQVAIEPPAKIQIFAESLPDVVVAYALYGDISQVDRLVRSNDPVNPMYMPMTVTY